MRFSGFSIGAKRGLAGERCSPRNRAIHKTALASLMSSCSAIADLHRDGYDSRLARIKSDRVLQLLVLYWLKLLTGDDRLQRLPFARRE
jgi:hypothetical protein